MTEQVLGLQDLATKLEQGIDPYSVVGKLYIQVLAKDQALVLAIQALREFLPKEEAKNPEAPAQGEATVIYGSPAELPTDAPEGTIAAVAVEVSPVTPMDSGVTVPGNDFGAMPRPKKARRRKNG